MSKSKHVYYGYYPSEDARDLGKEIGADTTDFTVHMCLDRDVRYRITVEKAPLQRKPKRRMK